MHAALIALFLGNLALAGGPKFDAASQNLVGTYATVDGSYRIVLDRFSQPPRMQVAGSKDVVQLTLIERTGRDGGWNAYNPAGEWQFALDANANLSKNDTQIPRVGDAKPLKKLTVTGLYVVPPTPYELAVAELEPKSVQKALQGFTWEDSGNPARVQEAIEAAPPELFATFVWKHDDAAKYNPVSGRIGDTDHGGGGGYYPTDAQWDAAATGAAKHGVVVEGDAWYDGRVRIVGTTPSNYEKALAPGTPGLVWSVDGATVVFVTLDAGRYTLSISGGELGEGGGLPVEWELPGSLPEPMQHTRLDGDDIGLLAKAKILPDDVATGLDAHDTAFRACVTKVFDGGKANLTKLAAADVHGGATQARIQQAVDALQAQAHKTCDVHVKAYETALLKQIDARNTARAATYAAAKTKLGK